MLVLNPQLLMTQGTIDGAIMSLDRGYAVNVGGGFHHSSMYKSGGFCIYPDIGLAIKHLKTYFNIQRSMVVDLDAHQGDGHERDFLEDPDVHIVDFYNPDIYPGEMNARRAIKTEFHVKARTTDKQYLDAVENLVGKAIETFKPQFILYNAGTDIAEGDRLGCLNVGKS